MWSGQSLYVNDVLESVDKNLWELECYAEFRTENKEYGSLNNLHPLRLLLSSLRQPEKTGRQWQFLFLPVLVYVVNTT